MNKNSINQEYVHVYSQLLRKVIREIFSCFTIPGLQNFCLIHHNCITFDVPQMSVCAKRQNSKLKIYYGHLISKC